MAKKHEIPEVDIVVDEAAGVIREVKPEGDRKFRSKRGHERRVNTAIYVTLVVMSIVWLCPFVFLVLQSFRSYLTEGGGMVNYLLPKQFSLDNYVFLFQGVGFSVSRLFASWQTIALTAVMVLGGGFTVYKLAKKKNVKMIALTLALVLLVLCMVCIDASSCNFVQWYLNTLTIALVVATVQTIMVLSVSYALSRMRFRGRKLLMNIMLIMGMFPGFLTMIALYFLLKQLGMTQGGAVPGLILIYCASSGMGYYISKGFFDTIPKSLDESARIDGATRFQVFLKIIMPMAKPIVIYTILMAFMAPWGDYVFASYVAMGKSSSYNVAVGLYRWVNTNDYQGYFTRFCAGGVLVAVPITALFMALQKYYVEGVTGGAVKG